MSAPEPNLPMVSADSEREWAWKVIERDLDLYKFYLEITLKVAAVAFSLTGAVVSFFLANADKSPWLALSLVLPAVLHAGLGIVCGLAVPQAQLLHDDNRHQADVAELTFYYDLTPLAQILRVSAVAYVLTSIGLVAGIVMSLL